MCNKLYTHRFNCVLILLFTPLVLRPTHNQLPCRPPLLSSLPYVSQTPNSSCPVPPQSFQMTPQPPFQPSQPHLDPPFRDKRSALSGWKGDLKTNLILNVSPLLFLPFLSLSPSISPHTQVLCSGLPGVRESWSRGSSQ